MLIVIVIGLSILLTLGYLAALVSTVVGPFGVVLGFIAYDAAHLLLVAALALAYADLGPNGARPVG